MTTRCYICHLSWTLMELSLPHPPVPPGPTHLLTPVTCSHWWALMSIDPVSFCCCVPACFVSAFLWYSSLVCRLCYLLKIFLPVISVPPLRFNCVLGFGTLPDHYFVFCLLILYFHLVGLILISTVYLSFLAVFLKSCFSLTPVLVSICGLFRCLETSKHQNVVVKVIHYLPNTCEYVWIFAQRCIFMATPFSILIACFLGGWFFSCVTCIELTRSPLQGLNDSFSLSLVCSATWTG